MPKTDKAYVWWHYSQLGDKSQYYYNKTQIPYH